MAPRRRKSETENGELAFAAMPDAFRKADTVSQKAQRKFVWLTTCLLVANVGAAILGGLGISGRAGSQLALVATGLFAVGLLVAAELVRGKPQRRWYGARAAAESAKTLAIQYAVGGGQFAGSNKQAEHDYRQAIASIPDALPNLPPLGAHKDPITEPLASLRASSLEHRREAYLRDRVQNQKAWYANKAERVDRAASRWRLTMFAGQVAGIGGGLLKAAGTLDADPIGIAAALTAAAAAWLRTKEYEGLAEAYAVAERELAKVEVEGQAQTNEEDWAAFVADAESAVSREHTLWLARRSTS